MKVAKLRYCQVLNLNVSIGALSYNEFSANSLYDPDRGSVLGTQPRGFDQLMEMYDHYTVIGSKITVTPLIYGNVQTWGGVYGLMRSDTTGVAQNIYTDGGLAGLTEVRGSVWKQYALPSTTTALTRPISTKMSIKKFFGHSPKGDSTLKGDAGSNPADEAFYTLWVTPTTTEDPTAAYFLVKIEYVALFTEPKHILKS